MTKTRSNKRASKTSASAKPKPAAGTKLEALIQLLKRTEGSDIAQMSEATGWLPHSVRGALAGALRKKGFRIESAKEDGRRVYRVTGDEPAQ